MLPARLGAPSSVRRQWLGLAGFTVFGAGLNACQFVLLPLRLSAAQLDILSVGVLITVTCCQMVGEAVANYVVTSSRQGAGRTTTWGLAVLIAAAVVNPRLATDLLAPGRSLTSPQLDAVRCFCAAGIAMLTLWRLAGRGQKHLDFWGLKAVQVTVNLAIVVGVVLPARDRLLAIAVTVLVATYLTAALSWTRINRMTAEPHLGFGAARTGASLGTMLLLSLTTYINVLLLRTFGAGLPVGGLGAVYLAFGVVQLPVSLIAVASASTLLPRWTAAAHRGHTDIPVTLTLVVVIAATAIMGVIILGFELGSGVIRPHLNPATFRALRVALPVLGCGVPLYAAAWLLRSFAIALGKLRPLIIGQIAGTFCIPLAWAISPTTAGLCAGFAVGPAMWLLAFGLMAAGHRAKNELKLTT